MVIYMNSTAVIASPLTAADFRSVYAGDVITVVFFDGTQATGEMADRTADTFTLVNHDLRCEYKCSYVEACGFSNAGRPEEG